MSPSSKRPVTVVEQTLPTTPSYIQNSLQSAECLPLIESPRYTTTTKTSRGTVLYLAYGSNLCSETFRGKRGIKPISSTPVHVPCLDLTFDLAGIPYIEPCFANTQYRDPLHPRKTPYHKDAWSKGLIGVVYEVTLEDYRTIIATEGGGSSYQDVIVECYAVEKDVKDLDGNPKEGAFKAHTLLSPRTSAKDEASKRVQRPDPGYAQPSARYLKLITDGAEEHSLPSSYKAYLSDIRPYTITSFRQRLGQVLFITFWAPMLLILFGLGKLLAGKDGRIPDWLCRVMLAFFTLVWAFYDGLFKKRFGDGERTMYRVKDGDEETGCQGKWCEKLRSGPDR